MSCSACVHWDRPYDQTQDRGKGYSLRPGKCYRHPTPIEVSPDHHCGEFTFKYMELGVHERNNWLREELDKQTPRAIAAEKALKVARAEIRELKRKLRGG